MENPVSLHYAELHTQLWPGAEQELLARLPAARRERLVRQERASRSASLLGFALLERAALALKPQRRLEALEFPAGGKPFWPQGPDFSITHAGTLVACALVRAGRIGLDMEPRGAQPGEHLRLVLDGRERAAIAAGRLSAIQAFVMKEAVVKASGAGLAALPRVRLKRSVAELDGASYWLRSVRLPGDCVAFLAGDRRLSAPTLRYHSASELALPPRT